MAAITGLLKNVRQRNSQRHIALGLQFSPRLRDLADQTLYRIDKSIRYQHISPLVRGAIQPRLFLTHWDDLLRTAGSLKLGWITASLFIAKLQSSRRKNVLTRALQEYGRLNPYGKYRFNVDGEFHRKGLRPLRQPDSALA